ncbi:uncharacterized protein G2W53_014629 [Senna tora]|uniref:Uncharacterized protein n=1 Tax=Senna tora TaxID=362788 RepID=A0A834WTU0_9FABA|nr:uncharacterized protein G2W53_014629 [Senna tora]
MDALLGFLNEILPDGAVIPNSYYDAKKVMKDLGLDACENDCILYFEEYANALLVLCVKSSMEVKQARGEENNKQSLASFSN